MPLNLIIKSKTPHWRKGQPTLGHFPSLHKKDSSIVDPSLSVKEMFSREERIRIDMACIHTSQMGVNFQRDEEDELHKEAEDIASRLVKGYGKIIVP